MRGLSGYHNNISGYLPATWRQSTGSPPPFRVFLPEAYTNVPRQVPLSGGYSGYDAFRDEATYPRNGASNEGAYSQVPLLRPEPCNGASVGQPAVGGSHLQVPAFDSQYPVEPTNVLYPPYTPDPAYRQYPSHMVAGGLQYRNPAVVQGWDALGGPSYEEPWYTWAPSQPVLSWPPSTDLYRSPPEFPVPSQGFGVANEHYLRSPITGPQPPSESPRREALVIGLNYKLYSNPDSGLKYLNYGVEDAYAIANFLCDDWGFAHKNVRIMTDESSQLDDLPTKDNIIKAMKELVDGAKPHDSFFLYFSGHGQQIKDLNGDELDGFDECLIAMDYCGDDGHLTPDSPGLIVDDLMHEILVKPLPSWCRLTAIFDACHSGTLLDLPYIYNSDGAVKHSIRLRFSRILKRRKSICADVISLGSSKDRQSSLETNKGGALRRTFIDCMRASENNITYRDLILNLREAIKKYDTQQQPQLSSYRKMDTSDKVVI